jgi:hypothetical protein
MSTSLKIEIAVQFMLKGATSKKIPVLLEITNIGDSELYFELNSPDYSLFSYE